MPSPLPYVPSYGKIKPLFEKIRSAKVPDAFTQAYLSETLGLTSSGDRPLIPLLRALDLIDAAGKPSPEYALLKNSQRAGLVIAKGIKHAFAPLFAANEQAHKLNNDELKGLVAQVAGSDDEITKRTAGTFRTLVELANPKALESNVEVPETKTDDDNTTNQTYVRAQESKLAVGNDTAATGVIRPEFHYNIQIHLPSNATEDTYLNIFNALRKALS